VKKLFNGPKSSQRKSKHCTAYAQTNSTLLTMLKEVKKSPKNEDISKKTKIMLKSPRNFGV
jgi:hypothetical protein